MSSQHEVPTYAGLASALVAAGRAEASTMMGHPCLRVAGRFFASEEKGSGALVLKLTPPRVQALIDAGDGKPFAPAGRTFRAWVVIPAERKRLWQSLLDEAHALACVA